MESNPLFQFLLFVTIYMANSDIKGVDFWNPSF